MTSNVYVMDASSLIRINRENPRDIFEKVWKSLEQLVKEGGLISPKEVLDEIMGKDDGLSKWAKKQRKIFKNPTQRQVGYVQEILDEYPSIIDVKRRYSADPWVIALALERERTPQKTLHQMKNIVVTEEKRRGERVRIPLICDNLSIETMDVLTMFRQEGWKF